MMEAVHRYEGYVAQSTGDGIFALFGAPVAHEDHPQRALHAALAMQEELRRYADRLRDGGQDSPLKPASGSTRAKWWCVRSRPAARPNTRRSAIRPIWRRGCRRAAPAGSIAVSEATQRLCEGYFEFRALGPTAVKGTQRAGRGIRGDRARAAADALSACGAARADEVRRARARAGGRCSARSNWR